MSFRKRRADESGQGTSDRKRGRGEDDERREYPRTRSMTELQEKSNVSEPLWRIREREEKAARLKQHLERQEMARKRKGKKKTGWEEGSAVRKRRRRRGNSSKQREELYKEIYGENVIAAQITRLGLPERFDSTKNRKVAGNSDGAAFVRTFRKYRQYMNRAGGFNKDLAASY